MWLEIKHLADAFQVSLAKIAFRVTIDVNKQNLIFNYMDGEDENLFIFQKRKETAIVFPVALKVYLCISILSDHTTQISEPLHLF